MRMACAIVFVVFTFLFVYDYQTDLIAYTQHVLSRGATTYNRIVGAVVITLALTLLSVGVRAVLKLRARFHALVYFPSLLLLALDKPMEPATFLSVSGCGRFPCLWSSMQGCCFSATAFSTCTSISVKTGGTRK